MSILPRSRRPDRAGFGRASFHYHVGCAHPGEHPMIERDVRDTLTNRMATHRIDLERLVAIPSVSTPGFDVAEVRRCAEVVRDLLTARGCSNARLLEVEGAHPAVYADWLGAGD